MTTVARHQSAQDIPATPATRQGERGFTLIELSIVLVIIGLLVGGVLQGQEMINNTRLKTTVAQTDAIQAAVQTFQDKFSQLPGDFNRPALLGNGLAAANGGDGDGLIDSTSGTATAGAALTTYVAAAAGEQLLVWDHLEAAGLMQGITGTTIGARAFPTKIDGGTFDVASFDVGGLQSVGIRMRRAGTNSSGILRPQDAFSLDMKYDDGAPNTGRWRGIGNDGAGTAVNCAAGTGATDGYTTGADTNACALVINVR